MAVDQTTERLSAPAAADRARRIPALTILAHAEVARVGDRVRLAELEHSPVRIFRLEPWFEAPRAGSKARPLEDPFVSRTPLTIRRDRDGFFIEAPAGAGAIVDGKTLDGARSITEEELEAGLTLELGPRVALLLHTLAPARPCSPALGLIGESDALETLRNAIIRVADLSVPVLIRGETGTGKELVARALHAASGRAGPLIAVNVAAIPATTASSALFGHVRGAFTGAIADLPGYFRDADGGTLFLDEIGEIPLDTQAMLLRAIESSEITPVGGSRPARVDVRVFAATDRDLEAGIAGGKFREALFHRLAATEIIVPPLAARRDDIGRLLFCFLREELAAIGREELLVDPQRRRPWLPASLVAQLARQPWPGNVRQLRNVARHLAVRGRDGDQLVLDAELRSALGLPGEETTPLDAAATPTPAQVLAALTRHKYRIAAAAAELGISRARMYTLAERSGGVRTARDVSREEIKAALAATAGDQEAAAAALRISPRALALRLTELGIERE